MRRTRTRTRFVLLTILLAAAGCSPKNATPPTVVAPRPVPRLSTSRVALTIERDGGNAGIELLDPASGGFTRLSPAGATDGEPAISPDGLRIAFVTSTASGQRLMTMAVDGTGRRSCGDDSALSASGPHWSPDGRRIAFTGIRGITSGPDIYTILASGDSLDQVTHDGQSYAMDWSPDGDRILFVYRQNIVFGTTGDYLRDVSLGTTGVRTLLGPLTHPIRGADYSPDGAHIAFCYDGVVDLGYKVEVCNPDGSGRTTIADGNPPLEGISAPSWSPDGSLILFSAHIATGQDDLYSATPSTFHEAEIFLDPTVPVREPSWGPKP